MRQRHWYKIFGGCLVVLGLGTAAAAASLDVPKAREATKELTRKNASALNEVSSSVPEELRAEFIEVVQSLEISRDRIIHFLDRIEQGVFPPEEGVERARAIAKAEAQKQKEFLQALTEQAPAAAAPTIDNALTVSTESWNEVMAAFQLSEKEEEPDVSSRPNLDILLFPGPPVFRPPTE